MRNITVSDIKKNNLSLIYKLIYNVEKCSKQEIANQLNLSLPTVTEKIVKLEKQGLITKGGHFESTVGRRAVAYSICPEARISISVRVLNNKLKILGIDLKGNICAEIRHNINFEGKETYYKEVSYLVKDFILSQNYLNEQVLGISFVMSGLTSVDRQKIIYGKTLGYSGLEITAFSKHLNYPCAFVHDAKAAASTELWFNEEITDSFYLSIDKYLGGAIIRNGEILLGDNGHCGAVEHMQLVPNGKQCYCGNTGCVETYCSINALLNKNEDIDSFFEELRGGSEDHGKRWNEYLRNLSATMNNLHLVLDMNIILGGKLSHYFIEEDFEQLSEYTESKTVFLNKGRIFYLSKYLKDAASLGGSLYYIKDFINQI